MTGRPSFKAHDKPARSIPVSDASWLVPLLDPEGMAATLAGLARPGGPGIERCEVVHVRYRPGTSCTVLYDVHLAAPEGTETISIYARRIAPGRLPASTAGPSINPGMSAAGRLLNGPTSMEPEGAVLREFPQDTMIPGLMNLQNPQGLLRRLAIHFSPTGTIPTDVKGSWVRLRYKPEHRLVLRADLDWWDPVRQAGVERVCQIRFEYGVDLKRRGALISNLSSAIPKSGILMAPAREVHLAQPGCTVINWREGRDLAGNVSHGDPVAAAAAGRALAALGRLEVPELVRRDLDDALGSATTQIAMLTDHPPASGLDARFTTILDRLARFDSGFPLGLVHGDFHQGQLLAMGDRICVLDWDRAHYGDQACDFGRFLAQLELLDLRGKIEGESMAGAFREAFVTAGGTAPDSDRESFWTVLALAELGLREIRRLRPHWRKRVGMILDRCDELLHRERRS